MSMSMSVTRGGLFFLILSSSQVIRPFGKNEVCSLRVSGHLLSVQFNHVQLCDPMDCSTPGFPVHHQLLELAETHVHRVGDAIQPSYPLSSPSSLAFNLLLSPYFSHPIGLVYLEN